ncbi:MAG: gamma-glutamyl-phosphate reductase, partial [Acidimicrobiaceae bacterium]|nr:gamma-glutamyl-phosphate reductase [Acidimicrobiaceae bacterium]
MIDTPTPIPELARRAKAATVALGIASTAQKDAALRAAADLLEANADAITEANAVD